METLRDYITIILFENFEALLAAALQLTTCWLAGAPGAGALTVHHVPEINLIQPRQHKVNYID